jgi:hypothetical protein
MLYATMPETAIYENCKTGISKNEIWFTEDFLIAPPALNVMPSKKCQ